MAIRRPRADQQLVQIVDAALMDAAQRRGEWLKCRPGCTQCCVGVFAISQLDVSRLREGMRELERSDAEKATHLKERIAAVRRELSANFPGDPVTGLLDNSEGAQEQFDDFANDVPCPVLDPATGTCELYEYRPMTCRAFGPPIRTEEGLGVCELCFQGASSEEIARCEMVVDPEGLEETLIAKLEKRGARGQTIVAMAFEDR
jgi:Fe-S-cluster containining protein